MNTDMYFEIYNYLVLDKRIDHDEAECIMSDIEYELNGDPSMDVFDFIEDLGL